VSPAGRQGKFVSVLMCINAEALPNLHKGNSFRGAMIVATQIRLPSRFPVGTRYIVEGEPTKGGQLRIISRYVVMPSGVRYDLMTPAERVRKPADLARKGRGPPQATRR
jgi:hypothetical protein